VQRMSIILKEFQGDGTCIGISFPRCICYCLTLDWCDEAVREFFKHGIVASVFSSKIEKDVALEGFRSGEVQVLCATSALGRGVHIECPIRFIFHLVLPISLTGALCYFLFIKTRTP
jgi:superfamily II DNA helicase RecQ